jgi:hypothetical protein
MLEISNSYKTLMIPQTQLMTSIDTLGGLHEIVLNIYLNFEQLSKTLIIPQLMLGVFRK